ncbi:hypothetical protein [Streptomyces sp. NPDC058247]|uniref:hypothetical protein n=1 Tax=Streptomyces sp. NPDC058247 TaxID=3346401 RepID=UPI0036EEC503
MAERREGGFRRTGLADESDRHGHSEDGSRLPGHGRDRGPGGEPARWQRRGSRTHEGRQGETDADAGDEHAGQERGRVVRRRAQSEGPPHETAAKRRQPAAVVRPAPRRRTTGRDATASTGTTSGPGPMASPVRIAE